MRRIILLLMSLVMAGSYTLALAVPAFRGWVGPCSVFVHCPESPGPTRYYYELEGNGFTRRLQLDYCPGREQPGWFRDLPPGNYTLRCDGMELARFTLEENQPPKELWPQPDWPVFPPR